MEALVTITGHVGSEVEYRLAKETWAYASFRLACTPRTWKAGGWVDSETTWLGVTCSRALAEHIKSSLGKGDPVIVVGRLRTNRWQDTNGVDQQRITIEATTVGHDLTRGTSMFRRVNRPVEEPVNLGELLAATERQDAEDEESEPERSIRVA